MINGVMDDIAVWNRSAIKDWILTGIVPSEIVNENLNKLQTVTITACVSFVAFIRFLSIL